MRPSRSKPSGWKPGMPGQPRLAARVRRVHVPVEHQRRPAARARPAWRGRSRARPRPAATGLRARAPRHWPAIHAAIASSEPVKLGIETRRQRVRDEALAVDRRSIIGSAAGPSPRTGGSGRAGSSPHSSSMTCVQPASRYSSIAAMQSAGVPAIGLHLSRIASVTCSFAASRPPRSIASATGRISSCSSPARSSSVSAAPWMFCTLFARYMPGDLARAVAALVAVLVDRGDDGAADVDVRAARSRACSGRTPAS